VRERAFNMAHNFTNSEMCDMIFVYAECGRQPKIAARVYARTYPEREQPYYNFFTRLESRLRKHGQFRPIKHAGTDLFIRFSGTIILNIVLFYHYYYISYRATTGHK